MIMITETREDKYTEKISQWLDNELSASEVTELQHHMNSCQSCQHMHQSLVRVDTMLRSAAQVMVAPTAGFNQRFETRLTHYQPSKPWQIWLAVSALLLGALFFFGVWAVAGGITLVTVSVSMLDAGLLYQLLTQVIKSVDSFFLALNFGTLFMKAGFITMSEPLFWGLVVVVVALIGLWIRVMQTVGHRAGISIQMML